MKQHRNDSKPIDSFHSRADAGFDEEYKFTVITVLKALLYFAALILCIILILNAYS